MRFYKRSVRWLSPKQFFFTPRMIVAGIQNIVMVVGFVSY
jgi:hypothetical protein